MLPVGLVSHLVRRSRLGRTILSFRDSCLSRGVARSLESVSSSAFRSAPHSPRRSRSHAAFRSQPHPTIGDERDERARVRTAARGCVRRRARHATALLGQRGDRRVLQPSPRLDLPRLDRLFFSLPFSPSLFLLLSLPLSPSPSPSPSSLSLSLFFLFLSLLSLSLPLSLSLSLSSFSFFLLLPLPLSPSPSPSPSSVPLSFKDFFIRRGVLACVVLFEQWRALREIERRFLPPTTSNGSREGERQRRLRAGAGTGRLPCEGRGARWG